MSKLTLLFKGKKLKVVQLPRGEVAIGSDPGCQVHIDSLAIDPRHATITTEDNVSILRDLSGPQAEGALMVNGTKVSEHTLQDGENIQIGKHTLEFSFSPTSDADDTYAAAKEAATKSAWLQILTGNNVGKTINLKNKMTNLGKAGVQTAVIARRGDGYFLTHLEGEHSPKVDGVPIGEKSHKLEDGSVIQLGNVKMQFTLA
ncbi:MAG: FHA domain-containing protein [Chromatiales bacterium]|nr:FHA domain-containing protein [Chromatiales bacterium]